jgi:hypothetical protein
MKSTHWFCVYKYGVVDIGNKSLLYDGLTYRIKELKSGDISWRYTLKTCKVRLRTDGESKLEISANTEHNHDTDARKVERQQIRVSVKRKANNDIAERPSKLIRSELQTGEEQHLTDNDLKRLSLAIYKQRRKRHPTLPKCIIDVHEALSTMTVKTSKSEDMCLVNDVDSHIIIILSPALRICVYSVLK